MRILRLDRFEFELTRSDQPKQCGFRYFGPTHHIDQNKIAVEQILERRDIGSD